MNAKTTEGTEAHGTIQSGISALPNVEDVRQADLEMGRARRDLNWDKMYELAIDPTHAKAIRDSRSPEDSDACTMCGDYCALKIVKQNLDIER